MRVLMISKACYVAAYRGKLAELARQPGLEVGLVVPPGWGIGPRKQPFEPGSTPGYRRWIVPAAFNGAFHLHFYPALGALLDRWRPDLLHVDEEPYDFATYHAWRLARRRGIPLIFFTWQNLARTWPPPFRWFERALLRHAAGALAGNQEAAAILRAKGWRGPLATIPQFGVDPELYNPHPPAPAPAGGSGGERDALPGRSTASAASNSPLPLAGAGPGVRGHQVSTFRIGYVGRLVPEKGVHDLLAACARLETPWRLVYIGGGPERERLARRAQALGLAERVELRGSLPSSAIPDELAALDALVLPSRSTPRWVEQFGRVLVEAMAGGLPVVGSDSGEIPQVIGDAGIVVPEGDISALSGALDRLGRDPALRVELAQRGPARVAQRYTHAVIAEDTARFYQRVMAQRARNGDRISLSPLDSRI